MSTAVGEARAAVAHAARVLAGLGLADLMYSASARITGTDRIAVTPGWAGGPPAPHRTTPDDILVVDPGGTVREGRASAPPLLAAHLAFHRLRPDVGAAAFICPPVTCAFGMARRTLLALPHMGGELAGGIAIDDRPGMPVGAARAEELVQASGDAPVVHLPGVGVFVVGAHVVGMLSTAYTLEYSLARVNAVAAQLPAGSLRLLRTEELARIVGQRAGHGSYAAFFEAADRPGPPPASEPSGTVEDVLRVKMAAACRILYAQGTLVAFLEHVSHRLPDGRRWLMSPAIHFGRMRPDDMIVLDEHAERLSGPSPAMFRFYHRDILAARPDVQAIVHTHDIYGRMFAQAGIAPQPVWRIGALHCNEPLPVFPQADLLFDEAPRRGAVRALGQHAVVHELGHGTDFVAPTLEEATVRAVQRETLLRAHFRALRLGTPAALPAETLHDLSLCSPEWTAWWAFYAALEADGVVPPDVMAGW